MTEKINKGCEFQSDCIEYKDISYLKVMPICAIYELSIACHHKVDRCKYYKLYKQLKRLEQENKELKEKYSNVLELAKTNADSNEYCLQELEKKYEQLRSVLEEISGLASPHCTQCSQIINIINEVLQ